ncbi:LamG domain-containing protein [Lacisediminihabitans sp. H27-G8]|uniref:LamG domain-containing protein n=1 Tax=Lacisediminihabitans sp. H27-G8 TaxID=3111909 RepID=UPI0038FBFD2A
MSGSDKKPSFRPPRLYTAMIIGLMLTVMTVPVSASAYWSAPSGVPGSGQAVAATVGAGNTPGATVATQNDITLRWASSTLSSGVAVGGYAVTRFNSTNGAVAATGACAGTIAALSCTELNVPDGVWTYTITPRIGTNWVGAESAKSVAATSDATAPTTTITSTVVTGNSIKSGNTVYYRGVAAGSLTLKTAVVDSGSGAASASTAALTGTTTGWSHTPSTVTAPTGGPFTSNLFTWAAGSSSAPKDVVTGRDVSGNVRNTTITFTNDSTGPTGGAISYATGATSATTIAVTVGAISDAQAGTVNGYRYLEQRTSTLDGTTCGVYGGWIDTGTVLTTGAATKNIPIAAGTCYQFRYRFSDSLGNEIVTTSSSEVKARSYQAIVAGTPGIVNYWRLADIGTSISDRVGTNNGTYFNGPVLGAAGAIAGDPNTAVTFDGVNDYGQVARQIADSFSIEFWFKSTQGLGSGAQWNSGAGLVDADVTGVANDFGISLLANGQVLAGIGNPDTTIASPTGKNDGLWHHVAFTRAVAGGQIILYLDGSSVATSTANTNSLTSSASVNFGRIATAANYYKGSLDEIAFYNSVLTPAQISNHYLSGLP